MEAFLSLKATAEYLGLKVNEDKIKYVVVSGHKVEGVDMARESALKSHI